MIFFKKKEVYSCHWIWGIHPTHVKKHTRKGIYHGFKAQGWSSGNPKQGYQQHNNKYWCIPKFKIKQKPGQEIKWVSMNKQECIPVGCVPSAAVAVCLGGCLPRGCLPRGTYTSPCGQTDTCVNITFLQLLLRTVKMLSPVLKTNVRQPHRIAVHNNSL